MRERVRTADVDSRTQPRWANGLICEEPEAERRLVNSADLLGRIRAKLISMLTALTDYHFGFDMRGSLDAVVS